MRFAKRKKKIVECARPFSEELAKIAQRERKCLDKLRLLTTEKDDIEEEQQASKSFTPVESDTSAAERSEIMDNSNVTESEINHLMFENEQLKQSLDEADKNSKKWLQKISELESSMIAAQRELRETRRRLSGVQERLTVAEQVTAATQRRELQESGGNSEQLQLELSKQHQPTTHTGASFSFKSAWK